MKRLLYWIGCPFSFAGGGLILNTINDSRCFKIGLVLFLIGFAALVTATLIKDKNQSPEEKGGGNVSPRQKVF